MDLYSFILENKYTLEAFYILAISLICAFIVIKTDKFFRLSLHEGIRYFRNAFFFFGIAFIARYVFGVFSDLGFEQAYIAQIAFEYLIIMAGFFLFYSLLWRRFESSDKLPSSSLLNAKIAIFHMMALVIALLDFLWGDYDFMFMSQILVFSCASVISFVNYVRNKNKHNFSKFYFVAMLLSLGVWILNFLAEKIFNWNPAILIYVSITNILFFSLFLYGIIKATKIK